MSSEPRWWASNSTALTGERSFRCRGGYRYRLLPHDVRCVKVDVFKYGRSRSVNSTTCSGWTAAGTIRKAHRWAAWQIEYLLKKDKGVQEMTRLIAEMEPEEIRQ